MFEQIRANKMKSMWIMAAMGALLLGFGYAIGYFFFASGIAGIPAALRAATSWSSKLR